MPIDLHMGVVLPFVSACLGPRTKGFFLTHPTVLNLFWINVEYIFQICFGERNVIISNISNASMKLKKLWPNLQTY